MMVVMSSALIFTYQSWLLGFSNICILTLIRQKSDVSEIIHTTAKKKKISMVYNHSCGYAVTMNIF